MRIRDVKTWAIANPPPHYGGTYWIILKLTTDDGIYGYGEAYGVPFAPGRVCGLIEDVVERHVIGRDNKGGVYVGDERLVGVELIADF